VKQLDARLLSILNRHAGPVKITELKRGVGFDCCYKAKTSEGYYYICVESNDVNTISISEYREDMDKYNLVELKNKPKNYRELP